VPAELRAGASAQSTSLLSHSVDPAAAQAEPSGMPLPVLQRTPSTMLASRSGFGALDSGAYGGAQSNPASLWDYFMSAEQQNSLHSAPSIEPYPQGNVDSAVVAGAIKDWPDTHDMRAWG
jgi:hypothetical protein